MLKILDENKLAKLKSETKTCAKQRKKLTGWYGARTGGVICKKKKKNHFKKQTNNKIYKKH